MNENRCGSRNQKIKDCGPEPFIANIDHLAKMNLNYRTALWTGEHLQVTLMCIPVGGDIGVEMHEYLDQFIRIEDGCALVEMGKCKDDLACKQRVNSNFALFVPACTWHNIINVGRTPLKLYSVYAPPEHPFGTVHRTKKEAECDEKDK
ncbi:MAG: cupin domain-containing protein [Eubacteriales bacterium]|jgi:mannose-6-phosphate isomerase-like protein (cupin superfamily)